jgi:acyl carrier protein
MTTAQEVPGWDSLAHINLVAAVEEEFRIRFAMAELQKLQNVGEMVALIERKAGRN